MKSELELLRTLAEAEDDVNINNEQIINKKVNDGVNNYVALGKVTSNEKQDIKKSRKTKWITRTFNSNKK